MGFCIFCKLWWKLLKNDMYVINFADLLFIVIDSTVYGVSHGLLKNFIGYVLAMKENFSAVYISIYVINIS